MRKKKRRENEKGKLFWECLVRRGIGENDGGAWVFSPWAHQKVFSSKWGENWVVGILMGEWQKCPCASWTLVSMRCCCCFFFFCFPRCCLFLFLFHFSFDFLGSWVWWCLFYLFILFRCDFFSRHVFYFLINLGDYIVFWLFVTFLF